MSLNFDCTDTTEAASWLLRTDDAEASIGRFYPGTAFHIPAAGENRFAGLLSVEELESYMRSPGFFDRVPVSLRVPGSPDHLWATESSEVFENASHGAAVQLVSMDRVLPDRHPLVVMLRALEELCGATAKGITVFVSPPGAAIPVHHDGFEVFTLQIAGTKSWHLYDFAPPSHEGSGYDTSGEPARVFDLGPGDLLYTPKNQVHHVVPGDDVSFSAALVLDPPSWLDVLEAARDAVADDPTFWGSLPPQRVEAGFEGRRRALIDVLERLTSSDFAARVAADRRARIPGLPDGHLAHSFCIDDLEPTSQVRLRQGPRPMVTRESDRVLVITPHCDAIAAPLHAAPALEFIARSNGPFRVQEICSRLDDDSKLALVRMLSRQGIVQPVEAAL